MAAHVTRNPDRQRFETEAAGGTAVLEYKQAGDRITLTHTEVPEPARGQGIAQDLARSALDYARQHNLRVVPQCPVVARFIERHRDYEDLVAA